MKLSYRGFTQRGSEKHSGCAGGGYFGEASP
jgi:hypothetical protein